jgi:murein DD-endopeptidase MepM/ murein hydrolase activator NlpD
MKRFLQNVKPFTKKVSQTFSKISQSVAFQTLATFAGLPYIVWQLFSLEVKWAKIASFISRISRKVLEFKKAKQVVGINLVGIFMLSSVIPLPFALQAKDDQETDVHIQKPEVTISTENTFRMPVPGYISQFYNWYHRGIDVAGNNNAKTYPIAEGKVVEIAYSPFGYGLSVMVDHGNGFLSRYAHLQKVEVTLDQEVDKTISLGRVGSTGWSTGPHLHLEVYQDGKTVNPLAYIPNEYQEDIKPQQSNNIVIAQDNGAKEAVIASMSAQIEYKQIVDDFTDPNDVIYGK